MNMLKFKKELMRHGKIKKNGLKSQYYQPQEWAYFHLILRLYLLLILRRIMNYCSKVWHVEPSQRPDYYKQESSRKRSRSFPHPSVKSTSDESIGLNISLVRLNKQDTDENTYYYAHNC